MTSGGIRYTAEQTSIASVCRGLPGPADPSAGIFVLRRLEAMARQARVAVLQPIPYFPVIVPLRNWAREPFHYSGGQRIEHAPMFYVPKHLKLMDGFWLYRSILPQLRALKVSSGLDLVDAHFGYPEGFGAYLAARKLGVPVFVTLRGFEAEYLERPGIGGLIRHMLRNVDGCICVAHFLQKIAIEHGAPPARTRVIHNAIDRSTFFPRCKDQARRQLGLPADGPLIVTVGHLTFRKRHHVLVSAFAELVKKFGSGALPRLLIIGAPDFEPQYSRKLKAQAERLGVAGLIDFAGNVVADRIADYLSAADVFALGTQREGCCNAVLEALACGLPVVTTPVGDNSWFVNEGQNGYLVPVDDISAMTDGLSKALVRRDWDRTFISQSLKTGSWDDVATQIMAFLREHRTARQQDEDSN